MDPSRSEVRSEDESRSHRRCNQRQHGCPVRLRREVTLRNIGGAASLGLGQAPPIGIKGTKLGDRARCWRLQSRAAACRTSEVADSEVTVGVGVASMRSRVLWHRLEPGAGWRRW
jgi:hypothetical protein